MDNKKTGERGEDIASLYLTKKGYEILERNYRTKYSEIDIIARKEKQIVFVEVRTKTNEMFGTPEETVKAKKKRKLKLGALFYAQRYSYDFYRIDLICIILGEDNKASRLTHYEDIIE